MGVKNTTDLGQVTTPATDLKISTASKGGVFNGGFELGTGTTNTNAFAWIGSENYGWGGAGSGASAAFTLSYDNTVSHSGGQSIKLDLTSTNANDTSVVGQHPGLNTAIPTVSQMTKYLTPVKSSTVYRLNFWCKGKNLASNQFRYKYQSYTISASRNINVSVDSTPTDWVMKTSTFTTGANDTNLSLEFYNGYTGLTPQAGTVWIDDITLEEVVPDTSFTGKVSEKIRPVFQAVTSTDNIDQSLDTGGAYANTYAVPAAIDEGATNRQTFTPTKKYVTQIGIWPVAAGTSVDWTITVHDSSNVVVASKKILAASIVTGAFQYWDVPYIWTTGAYHFHVTASATTGTPTLKTNTSNDLEACSFIQRYAKKSETFKLVHNGVPTELKSNSSDGLLTGAVIDLDNGKYQYRFFPADDGLTVLNDIYDITAGGYTSSADTLRVNAWRSASSTTGIVSNTTAGVRYISWKVNTILPIKSLTFTEKSYMSAQTGGNRRLRYQYSTDGINYITFNDETLGADGGYVRAIPLNVISGKSVVWLRRYEDSAESRIDYDFSGRGVLIDADIDTSSIPTGLSYPIGQTNQFTETVKLPSVATRAYFRLNKFNNEYGVPMPAIEFTDGSANFIGYVPLKLDNSQETNPSIRILSTTTNYQASGTGSSSDGYILNDGEYMTFTSTTAEIKIDYQVGLGTTTFSNITKNVYYLSSNGESNDATQDPSHQQNVIIGVRQQGLLDRVKDLGNEQANMAIGQYLKKLELSGLVVGTRDNNISIDKDGELIMNGTATVWEDLRTPMTAAKTAGAHDPGFAKFIGNGASQGVFAYDFDKTTEEELYFAVQLPHSYKIGSTIYPHVHWGVKTVPAGGTTVRWGLEYTWVDPMGVFAAPVIIYTTATDPVTQYKHVLSSFTTIAGTGITGVSSMLLCRIFRDVANDNFDDDASLFEFDIHYESDTTGSRTELTK